MYTNANCHARHYQSAIFNTKARESEQNFGVWQSLFIKAEEGDCDSATPIDEGRNVIAASDEESRNVLATRRIAAFQTGS